MHIFGNLKTYFLTFQLTFSVLYVIVGRAVVSHKTVVSHDWLWCGTCIDLAMVACGKWSCNGDCQSSRLKSPWTAQGCLYARGFLGQFAVNLLIQFP
jgi:hypothetical protein